MSSLTSVGFEAATASRRSIYKLDNSSPVPDSTIKQLIEGALLNVPSAFNNQGTRITLLLGASHKKLWSITGDILLKKIGEKRWNEGTKDRIAGFSNAYGTILFWDDSDTIKKLKENSPDIYKDKIEDWFHQANGMHQYYIWSGLSGLKLGANLQHYNPLIDEEVKKTWDLPEAWVLRAQMVFGSIEQPAGKKEQKVPMNERFQVFDDSDKSKDEL